MENKEIIQKLKLTASLMELHDENPFKVRSYSSAVYHLEKADISLFDKSKADLEKIDGIGKGIAATINEINEIGKSSQLLELLSKTPEGIIPLLDINGFGPKKIRVIWQELNITDGKMLLEACENGKIAQLKGFGDKLQENLRQALLFNFSNVGKLRYNVAEKLAEGLLEKLNGKLKNCLIEVAGNFRRRVEIIDKLEFVIGTDHPVEVYDVLDSLEEIIIEKKHSGPFCCRGRSVKENLPIEVWLTGKAGFYNMLMKQTGSGKHLVSGIEEDKSLYQIISNSQFESEEDVYKAAGLAYIEPELREGMFEFQLARENQLPKLLEDKDLKGILHNHTTYSDGQHSLREMAEHCKGLGYTYLGISDHSKTAVYANGLDEDRIAQQQAEIEQLNKELAPFKIFKGIESDILNNGDLDYDDDILQSFDFIVASIHSPLNMDINKATNRLLKAIANPFTTMLGHPTGRLLLKREGYPIDHKAVIDACANHQVIIEINAHPYRLDLDWRWVHYAIEKGVMLSINPDAHSTKQYELMRYGVLVGRKGGLTKEMTFNTRSVEEVEQYFTERKSKKAKRPIIQ